METYLLRMEKEQKKIISEIAEKERRSLNQLILFLIDLKINEAKNAARD